MPGSCYGSTGPLDKNPQTGEIYYHDFPFFTPRDMIRSYQPLKEFLGIEKIKIGIGGSMGGQQLLEWAIEEPDLFETIFPIATNARHSAWGIAFNASQRMSIEADGTWKEKNPRAGMEGMKAARSIALISYRHYETYHASQSEHHIDKIENYKSESYQKYQGEKLGKRFNAFSYYFLSKGMDSHNVGRGRGSIENALHNIKAKTCAIGITTDILFPANEQQFIAENIDGAEFFTINSLYGHDGFLLEYEQIEKIIKEALEKVALK
jgi:homoserine O-acetyltransferase